MQKVHLTPNEAALISWVTAYLVDEPEFQTDNPQHPMSILPNLYSRELLHEAGTRLEANFRGPGFCWLAGPLDEITTDILRICVENSDYASVLAAEGHHGLALDSVDAVRSLAYKLEELGVEVDYLPRIENGPTWSQQA